MIIFVTGGAGYIGSHTCVELFKAGHKVVVYDNLCNSKREAVDRIEKIVGQRPVFIEGDVRDRAHLIETMRAEGSEAVIHFAGLKAVGEGEQKPLDYYDNNVVGTLRVAEAMQETGVRLIIFSSSATVYGQPVFLPYTEEHPVSAINVYGHTKLTAEGLLQNFAKATPGVRLGLLRYFNPIGAHESGLIGEDPKGIPNNLMPYIAQVAVGKRPYLNIFGNDYDTPDGTGVRDYIHVVDLAEGHVRALEVLARGQDSLTLNLGTGNGASVLEVVKAFEKASGRTIPIRIEPRRAGDLPSYYADARKAREILGWAAKRDLVAMCRDTWHWQAKNPDGYV